MVIETSVREGGGQGNRRLASFSFCLLNKVSDNAADCAQECAQDDGAQHEKHRTTQSARVFTLSVEGGGLNAWSPSLIAI